MELLAVVLVAGALAAIAVPRMSGSNSIGSSAWREQVLSTLRVAHSLAQGHRRLVCASIAASSVTLTIASANPASSCNTALKGSDGDTRWAWAANPPATAGSPATLYFQPDGRITSNGAGTTTTNASVTISGETTISLVGETGHVQ